MEAWLKGLEDLAWGLRACPMLMGYGLGGLVQAIEGGLRGPGACPLSRESRAQGFLRFSQWDMES